MAKLPGLIGHLPPGHVGVEAEEGGREGDEVTGASAAPRLDRHRAVHPDGADRLEHQVGLGVPRRPPRLLPGHPTVFPPVPGCDHGPV